MIITDYVTASSLSDSESVPALFKTQFKRKFGDSGHAGESHSVARDRQSMDHELLSMLFKPHFKRNLSLFKGIIGPGTEMSMAGSIKSSAEFKHSELVLLLRVLEPSRRVDGAGSCIFLRDNGRLPLTIITNYTLAQCLQVSANAT